MYMIHPQQGMVYANSGGVGGRGGTGSTECCTLAPVSNVFRFKLAWFSGLCMSEVPTIA